LDLNKDYLTEKCLKNYEAALGDKLILSDDPTDLYYGQKRVKKTAEEKAREKADKLAQSDVIEYDYGNIEPDDYYVNRMEGGSYDWFDEDFSKFVCGNTNMIFYSNPKGGLPRGARDRTLYETKITLDCTTFDMTTTENLLVAHFSLPDMR